MPRSSARARSRRRLAAAVVGLAAAFAACGGGEGATSSPTVPEPGAGAGDAVVISTFIFRPDPLMVEAGTTVTFTNLDDILHTVTSGERGAPSGRFDARLEGVGSEFRFTFGAAGTFRYFCSIHPGMEGSVVVR